VRVTDTVRDTDTVCDERPVAIVGVTVTVTDTEWDLDASPVAIVRVTDGDKLCVKAVDVVRVTDGDKLCVKAVDFDAKPVAIVAVTDTVIDCVRVTDGDTDKVTDGVPDRHSVELPDSDAIVADALGVSLLGAQNGPMLNVARCVPSIEFSGDADAMDADPERDARTVATVAETE
jgi:hypothetical protein